MSASPSPISETFCAYLARQCVAQLGYSARSVQEAAAIADQADTILVAEDGYSFSILALIDREAHPGKAFSLSSEQIDDIAKACAHYAGRIAGAKIPVTIMLMEVGPGTPDQVNRLGAIKRSWLYARSFKSAWVIDTDNLSIWMTEGYRGRSTKNFIQRLLDTPRQSVVLAPTVVLAPHTFPWLTSLIIAALIAIFVTEIKFAIGGWTDLFQPTLVTLYAFGGLLSSLVVKSGEWYRLFAAPLLHADARHLALNAIALGLAGWTLEQLIGRAWFGALFVIGATSGAVLSLALNQDTIISVGASGAIMALFGAMLTLSRHFPLGGTRTGLQTNAIYILIPSLLPLASGSGTAKVDYAAHFGGAIAGIALGLLLLRLWRRTDPRPRLRALAVATCLAGLCGIAYAAISVPQNYANYELRAALAPDELVTQADQDAKNKLGPLEARYPRDPRLHFLRALALAQAGNGPGAENELRAALAEEAVWRRVLSGGDLTHRAHTLLALVLVDAGRKVEAKNAAKPACVAEASGAVRELLNSHNLCAD